MKCSLPTSPPIIFCILYRTRICWYLLALILSFGVSETRDLVILLLVCLIPRLPWVYELHQLRPQFWAYLWHRSNGCWYVESTLYLIVFHSFLTELHWCNPVLECLSSRDYINLEFLSRNAACDCRKYFNHSPNVTALSTATILALVKLLVLIPCFVDSKRTLPCQKVHVAPVCECIWGCAVNKALIFHITVPLPSERNISGKWICLTYPRSLASFLYFF